MLRLDSILSANQEKLRDHYNGRIESSSSPPSPPPPLNDQSAAENMQRNKNTTKNTVKSKASTSSTSRIPVSLQSIFLSSNRGNEITISAPPEASQSFGVQQTSRTTERTSFTKKGFMKQFYHRPVLSRLFSKRNTCTAKPYSNKKKNRKNTTTATRTTPILKNKESMNNSNTIYDDSSSYFDASNSPSIKLSPQFYYTSMLRSRGYTTTIDAHYISNETGYFCHPTTFQQASYAPYLIKLVKSNTITTTATATTTTTATTTSATANKNSDSTSKNEVVEGRNVNIHKIQAILTSGISLNPCNRFGESLIHTVCRISDVDVLKTMIQNGTSVQVSDDFGRTPAHDACWSSAPTKMVMNVLDVLLQQDPYLFSIGDRRGSLPLSYLHQKHWSTALIWLESRKERYWPTLMQQQPGIAVVPAESLSSSATTPLPPPPLTLLRPDSNPAPIPHAPLSEKFASLVVTGQLLPREVQILRMDTVEYDRYGETDANESSAASASSSSSWCSSDDDDTSTSYSDDSSLLDDSDFDIIDNDELLQSMLKVTGCKNSDTINNRNIDIVANNTDATTNAGTLKSAKCDTNTTSAITSGDASCNDKDDDCSSCSGNSQASSSDMSSDSDSCCNNDILVKPLTTMTGDSSFIVNKRSINASIANSSFQSSRLCSSTTSFESMDLRAIFAAMEMEDSNAIAESNSNTQLVVRDTPNTISRCRQSNQQLQETNGGVGGNACMTSMPTTTASNNISRSTNSTTVTKSPSADGRLLCYSFEACSNGSTSGSHSCDFLDFSAETFDEKEMNDLLESVGGGAHRSSTTTPPPWTIGES